MSRLAGMTDSNNNTIVNGVSYNAANQLLGMTYANARGYNALGRREPDLHLPDRVQQRQAQLDVQRDFRRNRHLHLRFAQPSGPRQ